MGDAGGWLAVRVWGMRGWIEGSGSGRKMRRGGSWRALACVRACGSYSMISLAGQRAYKAWCSGTVVFRGSGTFFHSRCQLSICPFAFLFLCWIAGVDGALSGYLLNLVNSEPLFQVQEHELKVGRIGGWG